VSSLIINTYADPYKLKSTFVKTVNVFGVDLSGQVHNLSLVSRILKHSNIHDI